MNDHGRDPLAPHYRQKPLERRPVEARAGVTFIVESFIEDLVASGLREGSAGFVRYFAGCEIALRLYRLPCIDCAERPPGFALACQVSL